MNWSNITARIVALAIALPLPIPDPLPPNIVVIVMDDMRWDEIEFMPLLASRVAESGVSLENAFVSNPLCCPSRASLLTGLYAKNHQVLTNDKPNGSVFAFDDSDTLGTRLQSHGYRTGLIGKYLNLYPASVAAVANEVPPGWSTFAGWGNSPDWSDWNLWVGSSTAAARGNGARADLTTYPTDELADRALDFVAGPEPFFLLLTPFAPHHPATPQADDINEYNNYEYRIRGYGESAIEDKPAYVQAARAAWQGDDEYVRDRLRCLLSADRAIDSLFDALPAGTIVVFTSDNGYMHGEHGLDDKGVPYEESIRVPLVIFADGHGPDSRVELVDAMIDVHCAVLSWAGIAQPSGLDCIGLRTIFESNADGRDYIYGQSWLDGGADVPGWAMIRTDSLKYVSLDTGEEEFYDLSADPYELENAIADPCHAESLPWFRSEAAAVRGLSMRTSAVPQGQVSVAYEAALACWGGTPPYTWTKMAGNFPAGLTMANGIISGAPTTAQTRTFTIRVDDANGQRESREFTLTVTP